MKRKIKLIKLVTKDVEFWLKRYDIRLFNQLKFKFFHYINIFFFFIKFSKLTKLILSYILNINIF